MADSQIIPSVDPASEGTLPGVIRQAFKKMLQGIDGQLPAQVISYDRQSNRATVQPLVTRLTTDGKPHDRGTFATMPVLALGGGGFYINFPLKPGDRGWIEASDRDISLFMQGDTMAQPNTLRMHSFSDGRFVPDVMGAYTFDGEDEGKMTISSLDGKVKITLSDEEIRGKATRMIWELEESSVITAPEITLNGFTKMTKGAEIANGLRTIGGETGGAVAEFTIPVRMPEGANIGGIEFGTHYHDTPNGPSSEPKEG